VLQNFWIGTDFAKLLSSLPVPNDGVKAMLESQARSLAALEEANQHAIDAFHAVFKRQNEIPGKRAGAGAFDSKGDDRGAWRDGMGGEPATGPCDIAGELIFHPSSD
jgi:hypothetical protein